MFSFRVLPYVRITKGAVIGSFLRALLAAAFVQGSLVVAGVGCRREPHSATCQDSGGYVKGADVVNAVCGVALSGPVVYLTFP